MKGYDRGTPTAARGSSCDAHPAGESQSTSAPGGGSANPALSLPAAKDGHATPHYDFSFIDLLGPLAGDH